MKASKWNLQAYPQSEGNLALAGEPAECLRKARPPHFAVRGTVKAIDEEDLTSDALEPAIGVLVGVGLSVILWVFLALLII